MSHDALVREIVEIGRVNSFYQVSLNVHDITIDESYEISVADLEHIVSGIIVHVDIDASSLHDYRDVIFTNERHACFEASSTTEGMHYIVDAENDIAEDAVLWTDLMIAQSVNVHGLLWANNAVIDVDALA